MDFDRNTTVEEAYADIGEWDVSCLLDEIEDYGEGFWDTDVDIGRVEVITGWVKELEGYVGVGDWKGGYVGFQGDADVRCQYF